MAPEYAMHEKFSVKSDVFSFGVLILEIISSQRNTCSKKEDYVKDLVSYAWSNWRERTITILIDPMLRGSTGPNRDIMRYIHIALLCIQDNVANRPNMSAVLLMLSGHSPNLPMPHNDVNPQISRMSGSSKLTESKLISSSGSEVWITELYPR
ncbi:cysteine-rich receptor-like protein kinase 44 [Lycium barbarum]|uniref:cysteine-rich receptor-like protein kinase 44 n=1 Tax=Lycium barbarum TaxID=112863 RepID=UPI00293E17D2|nr:cysteine-rich receptor-like protein kinase 44 [Lycium barbarum]XP_060194744.1 cysteine-rich receptor-like protein kinase 44 [Lycium barbarum]